MKTLNLFLLLSLSSCLYPGKSGLDFNERNIADATTLNEEEEVDYAFLNAKIIEPKCIRCHDDLETEEDLNAFIVPGDPENSSLYQMVKNGEMPRKGPLLSTAELEIVEKYILGLKPTLKR